MTAIIPAWFAFAFILGLVSTTCSFGDEIKPSDKDLEFFEKQIRPIFANNCQSCHGQTKQSAGLRLDSRESILKGGDSGPAIEAGKPEDSLLLEAVRHTDANIKMPPERPKLADTDIEALNQWVKIGAPWPATTANANANVGSPQDRAKTHWAFQPVRKQTPPNNGSGNEIDRWISAKLQSQGITPAPQADKLTLLRRATFDLHGLPPTPEQIHEFRDDNASDAFARLIDRLLASPRYGERWGRFWLDVARYADTKGYVFQEERRYPYSYTYRDYVIKSFNDDLPYNRFLLEQIAADRLEPRAQGDNSHLAAMGFLTVGRRYLNNQQDIIDDRIDVVTRGLMGLTVTCARCHDHKFDPIPTEDYYSLYGIFESSREPATLPELPNSGGGDRAKFDQEIAAKTAKLNERLDKTRKAKEAELRSKPGAYFLAAYGQNFQSPRFGGGGGGNRNNNIDSKLMPELVGWSGARWRDALNDPKNPLFAGWKDLLGNPSAIPASVHPKMAAKLKDKPAKTAKDVAERFAEFLNETKQNEKPDSDLNKALDGILTIDNVEMAINRADRNEIRKVRSEIEAVQAKHPGAPPRAMVMNDAPDAHDSAILIRGNPGRRGAIAPRRFLKTLSSGERPLYRQGSGRLEFAQAVTNPANPLTTRVWINRVWLRHFGQPLVETPSDFGLRCEPPAYPELLDWLAATFVEEGWSTKKLHKRIMLSDAYQRSSTHPNPVSCEQQDPTNLLVWKQNRQRLDFESMRDSLLAASGQLDLTMGGKSVDIVKPPFSTRRAVYCYIDRQNLESVFRIFDFADPNLSNPKRHQTIVPQQALFFLNSPFVAEQAQHCVEKLPSGTALESRIELLYKKLFGRPARPDEVQLGLAFLAQQIRLDRSKADPASVTASVANPEDATPEFWARYAQTLMMTNEFLFVD